MTGRLRVRWTRATAIIALLGALVVPRAFSQTNFGLSVTSSPNPVLLTQPLTYNINLTNLQTFTVPGVFVTNHFSARVLFVSVSNNIAAPLFTNGNDMTFQINSFFANQVALLTLVVSPREFGPLTNTVTVSSLDTNLVTTNVLTQVIAGQADLAVGLVGPTVPILANDWISYTLAVTNLGPGAAPGVTVSNALPVDAGLISVTVSNEFVAFTNHSLIWSVGTLGSGERTNLSIMIQPTNAGTATLWAGVAAANVIETDLVNNSATNTLTISPLVSGSLVASNVSAMTFNPQTALMEQTVRLVNTGETNIASARIIVSGLTNRLFNAVGTNDYQPFVVYGAALSPAQSVDLVLEYFVPTRRPIEVADAQLHPYEVPSPNSSVPVGTPFSITLVTNLPSGSIMIEFQSTLGRNYTILYADNPSFTNELAAQPSIVAPANRVQWIDDGPPKTLSRPTNATSRFYRVIQNQ